MLGQLIKKPAAASAVTSDAQIEIECCEQTVGSGDREHGLNVS